VRRGDADRHDRAHQRGDVERRAGDEQHGDDAAQGRRQRQDYYERIAKILVVDDHEQIDEHGCEQQPDAQIPEGIAHALDLPENLDRVAGLELLLQLGDDLADVVRDAAEIATLHAGIDVAGWILVWLRLVGTLSRCNVATLLKSPGIGGPLDASAVETGVLPISLSELTRCSGVWTVM